MYYNRGRLLSRKQPSVVVSGIGVPGLFRCGDVGKQLIQRALKGQQLLLDILQLLDLLRRGLMMVNCDSQ